MMSTIVYRDNLSLWALDCRGKHPKTPPVGLRPVSLFMMMPVNVISNPIIPLCACRSQITKLSSS